MSKRLLSKDYQEFSNELITLHPNDAYHFTLDFCEKNYIKNNHIIEDIIETIRPIYKSRFDVFYSQTLKHGNRIRKSSLEIKFTLYDYEDFEEFKEDFNERFELLSSVYQLPIPSTTNDENYNGFLFNWIDLCLNSINYTIELLKEQRVKELNLSKEVINSVLLQLGRIDFSNLDFNYYQERVNDTSNFEEVENTFNNEPIKEVKEFFKSLYTEVNTGGEKFLTKEEFDNFISRAFQNNNSITPLRLRLKRGDKTRVQYLFFEFKEYCKGGKGTNNEKYITLLTDNFTNYEFATVKGNFDKKPDDIYQLPNLLNNKISS